MKKGYFFLALIMGAFTGFGQEMPFFSQYLFHNQLINPALSSRDDCMTVRMTDRHQWVGINDAPRMQSLSINWKIKNMVGIGSNIYRDKNGPLSHTGIQFNYFFNVNLANDKIGSKLAFGIYGAMFYDVLNEKELFTLHPDNALTGDYNSAVYPRAGAGILYYNNYFSAGISACGLIPVKSNLYDKTEEPGISRTYFFYADYQYSNVINTIGFVPSLVFRMNERLKSQIDINAKIYFWNTVWAGLSYRNGFGKRLNHSIMGMVGLRIFDTVFLAYGYDANLGFLQGYRAGGHEAMIGGNIYLNKNKSIPRYF